MGFQVDSTILHIYKEGEEVRSAHFSYQNRESDWIINLKDDMDIIRFILDSGIPFTKTLEVLSRHMESSRLLGITSEILKRLYK